MRIEFRKASTRDEIRSLMIFDRKVFSPSDCFPAEYWKQVHAYWMLLDGIKAGCCAFEKHVDFEHDRNKHWANPRLARSIYIASTAILPRFQGQGLGSLLKAWQVAYAWHHQFDRIITNTRKRNKAMIDLNRKFHFKIIRVTPLYYSDPVDSTVVMELRRRAD